MQGELKPNSHYNIKMTLMPGKYPCNFEGEIQCSIDWENDAATRMDEAKSVATNTAVPEASEFLFLRLKKRQKTSKINLGADVRDGESLIENILNEAMHEILESDEFDKLLDDQSQAKAGLYEPTITDQAMPDKEDQIMALEGESKELSKGDESDRVYDITQGQVYEDQIKKVFDIDDD